MLLHAIFQQQWHAAGDPQPGSAMHASQRHPRQPVCLSVPMQTLEGRHQGQSCHKQQQWADQRQVKTFTAAACQVLTRAPTQGRMEYMPAAFSLQVMNQDEARLAGDCMA